MSPSRTRGRTRPPHMTHHSRNCTQPSSSFPWLLVAISLPASMVLFYNLVVPIVASFVGISVSMVNPYHLGRDVWLQLTCTCPVLVDSRSRDLLVSASKADEVMNSNYDALIATTMVTHKRVFNVNDPGISDFLDHTYVNTDNHCEFQNYLTDVINVPDNTPMLNITQAARSKESCLAGRFSCGTAIDLSKAYDNAQVVITGEISHILSNVEGVIIATEPVDFVPVPNFTDAQHDHDLYVQITGSIALYCQTENDQPAAVQFNLNKGDAVILSHRKCEMMTISGQGNLAIGIIVKI